MRKVPLLRRITVPAVLGFTVVSFSFIVGLLPSPMPELSLSRVVDVHEEETLKSLDWRFPLDDTNDDRVVIMRVKIQALGYCTSATSRFSAGPMVSGCLARMWPG
jgi:hypothetical protein